MTIDIDLVTISIIFSLFLVGYFSLFKMRSNILDSDALLFLETTNRKHVVLKEFVRLRHSMRTHIHTSNSFSFIFFSSCYISRNLSVSIFHIVPSFRFYSTPVFDKNKVRNGCQYHWTLIRLYTCTCYFLRFFFSPFLFL